MNLKWLRGCWRLLRVAAHIGYGVLKVYTRWHAYDAARRKQETMRWSSQLLAVLGVRLQVQGQASQGTKLIVANHVSWLDIVTLNAVVPARFVSKAEVGTWPLIGRLVHAAGTLYLVRERRRDAARVLGLMVQALREGSTVAVFPEGTTGDGQGLLPFHANLMQAAIDAAAPIQPVVLRYSDPHHAVSSAVAYVGDTTIIQSLWMVATSQNLTVHVRILPLQQVAHADRRALTAHIQNQIDQALADDLARAPQTSGVLP